MNVIKLTVCWACLVSAVIAQDASVEQRFQQFDRNGDGKLCVVQVLKSSKDTWFRRAFQVNTVGQAGAVFDVDGDGTQDILLVGGDAFHFLINHLNQNREPQFAVETHRVERTQTERRGAPLEALGLHDLNRDGRLDPYLCRVVAAVGARGADEALLNRGPCRFERVDLGIAGRGIVRGVLFSDFDGDGHFDTYHTVSTYSDGYPCRLHAGSARWDRFGPDILREAVADPSLFFDPSGKGNKNFKGAIIRDLDGDGKPDIVAGAVADSGVLKHVAAWERGLFIFHNVSSPGQIRFEEVGNSAVERAHSDGIKHPQMHIYSVLAADINRDGKLDLFVAGPRSSFAHRSIEDKTPVVRLLRNDSQPGRLKFTDTTEEAGLGFMNDERLASIYNPVGRRVAPNLAAGAALDIDNDGHVDFVLVNRTGGRGDVNYASWVFHHDGHGHFNLERQAVTGISRLARDIAFGDLNNDGRLDLVFVDGSDGIDNRVSENSVFLNQIRNDNHWIKLNVTWPENPFGIESKVTVFKVGTEEILSYDEVRTDFCYRSKKSPTLHFGLGPETVVDVVGKTRSGAQQRFANLKANQTHTLTVTQP